MYWIRLPELIPGEIYELNLANVSGVKIMHPNPLRIKIEYAFGGNDRVSDDNAQCILDEIKLYREMRQNQL